jgi:hypothetical protein
MLDLRPNENETKLYVVRLSYMWPPINHYRPTETAYII